MKKKNRETEEQLNNQLPAAAEQEQNFTLEEIMREFGGWSNWDEPDDDPVAESLPEQKPEPAPAPISQPVPAPVEPITVAQPEPEEKPEPPKPVKIVTFGPEEKPEPPKPIKIVRFGKDKEPEAPKPVKILRPETEEKPEAPAPIKIVRLDPEQKTSDVMRVAAEAEQKPKEKPSFKLVDLSGDTIPFRTVREEDLQEEAPAVKPEPVEMPEEPAGPEPDRKQEKAEERARKRIEQRLRKQEAQRRKAQKQALRAARREEPEMVYPSPEDACAAYAKVGSLRLRLLVSGLLVAVSLCLLVLTRYSIGGLDLSGSVRLFSTAMLALLLGQCLLSYEVFVRGIYQALTMRFDLMSLLTLTTLVSIADSFFAIPADRAPFCTCVALVLLLALWSVQLEKKAKWRTLKTVLSMENPVGAVKVDKAWHGLDCIFRREGSLNDFTAMLETPDAAQKVMRVYAPLMAVVTAVIALMAAVRGSSFLWAWSALLLAALPGCGLIACCRPFSILAKRLHQAGAAICGWRGAKILSGESGIVLCDQDLFSAKNLSLNGMKMYSDLPIRQVVGYATAVVQAAGSGLLPLFEEVLKNENGRRVTVDSFRQYEGGGLGAEIHGDVVLLGSLPFMRLMGVHVPEGTKVQSAAYISVNKELVGVFALTYTPSASAKSGLHSVIRSNGLTPILATRDFMITPALVKKRYKISVDRMEFPVVSERVRLSAPGAGEKGKQGALMAKDSFLSFSAAVTGGRLLRRAVHSAVLVAVLGGILGVALMCVLTYLGSVAAASAMNLLLYQLLWLIPGLLITGLIGKS